jgi:3'-phosphoadenosine 5'-phosphosulfate sulfotransferase (PAPS reductase)/FAD synthetase
MKTETEHLVQLISLGAGVQSSTMALMATAGEIGPMPKAAIFADTQDEPASVYRWLDWLEKQLPFPVVRVTKGKLSDEGVRMRVSKKGHVYSRTDIPYFTLSARGELGKIPNRSCTKPMVLITEQEERARWARQK